MRRISLLLYLGLIIVFARPHRPIQAQGGVPVLVYYYAWWAPQAVGEGKSPDWPPAPYHSWDTAVLRSHVSQIAGVGIDGLVVAWYGPTVENNQTETNFRFILDQAAASGTTALLSVDLGSSVWFKNVQEVVDGLRYALDIHAQHPAYFRYNNKPVLFFWFQGRYTLEEWAYIRQQVDPGHESIWIAEGAAPDAIPTFDGLHMYTISWSNNVNATLSQWGNTTRSRGGLWVATAMPGWDNTFTQQSERYIRERNDGAFYRETFSAAAASSPAMVVITSWNEWWEGTHIEPSVKYGDFYLSLTASLISEFNASGSVTGGGVSQPDAVSTISTPSVQQPTQIVTVAPTLNQSGTVFPTPSPPSTPSLTATSTLPPTVTGVYASPTPLQAALSSMDGTMLPTLEPDIDEGASWITPGRNVAGIVIGGGIALGGTGLLVCSAALLYTIVRADKSASTEDGAQDSH